MSDEIKVPVPPSPVDEAIKTCEATILGMRKKIEWFNMHRKLLETIPNWSTFGDNFVDFEQLNHKQVIEVIRHIGGKWSKEVCGEDRITYSNYKADNDMVVRCYKGEPPPSCKIIEVEEHVPSKVIPASVRKVKKLVCQPSLSATIAQAAEKGVSDAQVQF